MTALLSRCVPAPGRAALRASRQAIARERTILAALEVFHRDLGDVFRLPMPGFNPVMVAGPEACRAVLVTERGDLRWRAEGDPVTRLLNRGVLVVDGDEHDLYRRAMTPTLHKQMLNSYVAAIVRRTDDVLARWPGGGVVNALDEMRRAALLILLDTLYGVDFSPDVERLWTPILKSIRYISPGLWMLWRGMPRPGYCRALATMDAYLYAIIGQRRTHPRAESADLITLLIAAGLDDDRIRDQLLTMLIAGHDTSTALLSWALYLLATHPGALDRAAAEVDAVLGDSAPMPETVAELRYLGQVADETLRLYPPIHLGSRQAVQDLTINGFHIPAGTRVLYSIYLTHRHPAHWPDPARFDPDRFAPEAARARPPYTFLPFGGGPRNCIGAAFGQVEAKVVLARILQGWRLGGVEGRVIPRMGATLEPRGGLRLGVARRR